MKKNALLRRFFTLMVLWLVLFNAFTQTARITVADKRNAGAFPLVAAAKAAGICFDTTEEKVVQLAAGDFANDVHAVTAITPLISGSTANNTYCIIAGTIGKSKLIDQLVFNKKINVTNIRGKWETFSISVVDAPLDKVKQALVIAGSDPRSTAFGIYELSKLIGVSPFYWWADIIPRHKEEIFITKGSSIVGPPSVKYRGIFINDEDWGLQPWAAKTFEPETGDIGPKTYAKIFELLLRLKANMIWPAMHPSTKAFYSYPGNKLVAKDYSIYVGSSHAEPMLRNNVSEWDKTTMGEFNYITNKQNVYKYWEDRVKESSVNKAIYSLGMRGIHDSGIEGVKTPEEAVPLLEKIFADQRGMLQKYINKNVDSVPQVFTAYKEVLDIYDSNLKLSDDVTLVWPDDNYGYIQRLNTEKEKGRTGGSGVYYHASYWGRPHDYLWLSTTHPALIREEMVKAYEMKSDKLWVLNVGDIKPLEYNIEMFLDMAFDITPFKNAAYSKQHMLNWATHIFGDKAIKIQEVLWEYYQLAFERRPEFMGWSQTEPTTKTTYTDYNHFYYGDEAQQRIDRYEQLEKQVKELRLQVSPKDADAYYELVYYPVEGASLMNKKFVYRDKSYFYSRQNRLSAFDYALMSRQAYDSIVKETTYYNNGLANGKWRNIMSMKPRDLPVYLAPDIPQFFIDRSAVWSVAPEGFVNSDSSLLEDAHAMRLPAFDRLCKNKYFIDIFLNNEKTVEWHALSDNWIKLTSNSGTLEPEFGKKQSRVWITIDWSKAPAKDTLNGKVIFTGMGKNIVVHVKAVNHIEPKLNNYRGYLESNQVVSIYAADFSRQINKAGTQWEIINGLGHTGKSIEAMPLKFKDDGITSKPDVVKQNSSFAEYDFYTFSSGKPEVSIYSLPTLPVNKHFSMRYAISVDNGPLIIQDFKTVGRSEEWKQNVLRNSAIRKIVIPHLNKGYHTLKVYTVDPGVIIDRILIDLGGYKKAYSILPETKLNW